ncbi:MAG TPA: hypothetical protein EYH54_03100 [Nautiliaceae bacterium]|nr:hypothetical protein [Nautiliaceae bacterium]
MKSKIKKKILFRYYKDLLELYKRVIKEEINYKNEIIKELKEKIILIEKKLRFKFTKICWKCGSSNLKYRIKKDYTINICLDCGYQNFISIKKD